jgi:hypothetical protein
LTSIAGGFILGRQLYEIYPWVVNHCRHDIDYRFTRF